MTSISDVLKASKGLPVDDIFAELWGRKLSSDYTIDVYTGTLPAVLTGTKAGYLHRYKIYGNTEQTGTPTPENPIVPSECGERTENLFDESTITSGNYATLSGTTANNSYYCSDFIPITAATYYFQNVVGRSYQNSVVVYDTNKQGLRYKNITGDSRTSGAITFQIGDAYIRVNCNSQTDIDTVMINIGSTALPYEPYGYKLPLTSGSTPVDIYIGDDTLSTDEYVDSGTGKIYRMVDGVLTPVDPPAPFPQIPTSAGSTTISWAGSGLAPSQVEFEYERK